MPANLFILNGLSAYFVFQPETLALCDPDRHLVPAFVAHVMHKVRYIVGMAGRIKIKAIEELRARIEGRGGIALADPPLIAAQLDYLLPLSMGLSISDTRIRRLMLMDIILTGDPSEAVMQEVASILIYDVIPLLRAEPIVCPEPTFGSFRWRPWLRTTKPYTAAGFDHEQDATVKFLESAASASSFEEEYLLLEEVQREDFQREIEKARDRWLDLNTRSINPAAFGETNQSELLGRAKIAKVQWEALKARFEAEKAEWECKGKFIDAVKKLLKLLRTCATTSILLIGCIRVVVPGHSSPDKPIRIEKVSPEQAHSHLYKDIATILEDIAQNVAKRDE
jgi:hypothetical protein